MNKTADEILTRGVGEVLPSKESLSDLMNKKKIRVYFGIDPTGTKLHLGHSIPLRKLQAFADDGHEAILLFGTGTVLAGDPSQREKARKKIDEKEIKENISSWKDQVKKIIDFDKVKILENADWLLKLNLGDVIKIASNISATQLIKRDMFQKRIEKGDTVWTHEILYPLLQGYDSVEMDVDLEIGGSDQTFNMLIGRELMKKMKGKEKYVLATPMITGTDGEQMSKSSGNCIWLSDSPNEMYGKVLSISDKQIQPYMLFLTNIPEREIKVLLKDPLSAKKKLAHELVKMYHTSQSADDSQSHFEKTFQKGEPEYETKIHLGDNFVKTIAPFTSKKSTSEARRLISQGSIDINGNKTTDPGTKLKEGDKIRIGSIVFGTIIK